MQQGISVGKSSKLMGLLLAAAYGCGQTPDGKQATEPLENVDQRAQELTRGTRKPPLPPAVVNSGVLNVQDFGAKGDGSDAEPGIAAAIAASCADRLRPPVFIPNGSYSINKPIRLSCDEAAGMELFGASRTHTLIKPNFIGPAFFLASESTQLATVPALVGTGRAMRTDSTQFLNLRDLPTLELDGADAFTVETFFQQERPLKDVGILVASHGILAKHPGALSVPGFASAFGLSVLWDTDASGVPADRATLSGSLNINGQRVALSISFTEPQKVHHVALSFDGAQVRLFLDGELRAERAAQGKIQQAFHEDVMVSVARTGLEGGAWTGAMRGALDVLRVSDVARYVANFAVPTQKPGSDANTLALLNFDDNTNGLVKAYSRSEIAWLPLRETTLSHLPRQKIHNLGITGGSGIFAWNTWDSHVYQVSCNGCDYGFVFGSGSSDIHLDDISASAGPSRGRHGLLAHGATTSSFRRVSLDGYQNPLVVQSGAQAVFSDVTIRPQVKTAFSAIFNEAMPILQNLDLGASALEGGSKPAAFINSVGRAQILGGRFAAVATGSPLVSDGGAALLVDQAQVLGAVGTASAVEEWTAWPLDNGCHNAWQHSLFLGDNKPASASWSTDTCSFVQGARGTLPSTHWLRSQSPGPEAVFGSAPAGSVLSIADFGAKSDGSDAAPAVQRAVDAACARRWGMGVPSVFIPVGVFELQKPITVSCDDLEIYGASRIASVLRSTHGPALVLRPRTAAGLETGPGLLRNSRQSLHSESDSWLDLRDTSGADLNNKAEFTAEAVVKLTGCDRSSGYQGIVQSTGCLGSGGSLPGCTSAFRLGLVAGRLYGLLNLNNRVYELNGPLVSLNQTHHVALTYNTQTLRLLLDGREVAQGTASGTITQGLHESVTVGPATRGYDTKPLAPSIAGYVDSLRLSDVARYAPPFERPTRELEADFNALVLLNFENNQKGLTEASVRGESVWLPVRRAESSARCDTLDNVKLRGFTLEGGGIWGFHAVRGSYEQLGVRAAHSALVLNGRSEGSVFSDLNLNARRTGLWVTEGRGNTYQGLRSTGAVPLVLAGGVEQNLSDILITPHIQSTQYSALFIRSGVTMTGYAHQIRSRCQAWQGNIVVDSPATVFRLFGGQLNNCFSGGIPLIVDGGAGAVLQGTVFQTWAHPTNTFPVDQLVKLNAPLAAGKTIEVIGIRQEGNVPISNDPKLVSIAN